MIDVIDNLLGRISYNWKFSWRFMLFEKLYISVLLEFIALELICFPLYNFFSSAGKFDLRLLVSHSVWFY